MRTLVLHPETISEIGISIKMDNDLGIPATFHLVVKDDNYSSDEEIVNGYLLSIDFNGMICYTGVTNKIEGIDLSDSDTLIITGVDLI